MMMRAILSFAGLVQNPNPFSPLFGLSFGNVDFEMLGLLMNIECFFLLLLIDSCHLREK